MESMTACTLTVCMRPYTISLCIIGSSNCPLGWMVSGNRCYGLMTHLTSWFSAEDDCMSQDGHLVSIASDSENSMVYNLRGSSALRSSDIWIGLNDQSVFRPLYRVINFFKFALYDNHSS